MAAPLLPLPAPCDGELVVSFRQRDDIRLCGLVADGDTLLDGDIRCCLVCGEETVVVILLLEGLWGDLPGDLSHGCLRICSRLGRS